MSQVSLKSIADELGVSISLVSKVLSGRMGTTGANPKVAENIQETARRLGYRKNRTAAALASGRHGVIAAYVHHHGEAGSNIVGTMTQGIAEEAAVHRLRLWLQYFHTRDEFLNKAGDITQSSIDGLIVAGVQHHDMLEDFLQWQAQGLPLVSIHPQAMDDRIPNVGCSEERIGQVATEHLLARGCRHIAHIGEQKSPRRDGYKVALARHGLAYDPAIDVGCHGFGYSKGEVAIGQLIASGHAFDGVVLQSDHLCLAAYHVLQGVGRSVPDDVKLIGIDDSPVCELSPKLLSSVSQQFAERGELAVRMMTQLIDKVPCTSIELEPVVRHRESS